MKFIMNDAFKGATGKICSHSDMGTSYNGRTGLTYSHKLCNKRDISVFPYNDKEIAIQSTFKTRAATISATVKSLTDTQRKALLVLRNERRLYCIRQLIEEIYDKDTNTVPATALAELVALGTNASTDSGSGSSSTGGTSTGGDDEGGM